MNSSNGRLHHKVIGSSWERCDWLSKMTHFVAMTEGVIKHFGH